MLVPAVKIFSLWAVIDANYILYAVVFQAVGKPGIDTRLRFVKMALLGFLIYPLTVQWGISGAALAVLLSSVVPWLVGLGLMAREFSCPARLTAKLTSLSYTVPLAGS